MNKRTLALMMGLVMTISSWSYTAIAQPTAEPPRAEEIKERLAEAKARLHLTPDQEEHLRPLLEEEGEKLRAIKAKYGSDTSDQTRRAMFKEMRVVQQDFRAKLSGILSPEQMAEWDKMRSESRARMRARRQQ
jgi:hypothetical protein